MILTQLRSTLRSKRQALLPSFCARASLSIVEKIIALSVFQKSQAVALYLPVHNEVSLLSLLTHCPDKTYYLPILTADQALLFGLYTTDDLLQENHFGILEPKHSPRIHNEQLDLVCMPMVGFDPACHRLGMGGGYYDRSFAFKQQAHKTPYLLGVAYECQKVDTLAVQAWDVSVDSVVTEKNVYVAESSSGV